MKETLLSTDHINNAEQKKNIGSEWFLKLDEFLDKRGIERTFRVFVSLSIIGSLALLYKNKFSDNVAFSTIDQLSHHETLDFCLGDFDLSRGVYIDSESQLFAYNAFGNPIEVGEDGEVLFENGELRILKEYKGNKEMGIRGWVFEDKNGVLYNGNFTLDVESIESACLSEVD